MLLLVRQVQQVAAQPTGLPVTAIELEPLVGEAELLRRAMVQHPWQFSLPPAPWPLALF